MRRKEKGFTLLELMVSIGVMTVVAAAALSVYIKSGQVATQVGQNSEMQSEIRAAANQLSRDLNQAGTGIPLGGIPIPSSANGATNPSFACDFSVCYLSSGNTFTQGVLYKVTPGYNIGPNVLETSDAIVMTYLDPSLPWSSFTTTTLASDGSTVTMPSGTTPALNDAAVGLNQGDVLLLQNSNGSAVGVVTSFNATTRVITFGSTDPLHFNQTSATTGNIKALKSGSTYPATTVSRIYVVAYFLQNVTTADGTSTRLMRQVNARTPTPVAENIVDLKFTYDIFDSNSSTLTAGLTNAATGSPAVSKPDQIKKINFTITARSPRLNSRKVYDYVSFSSSIGPRNLSFHDRYS